MQPHRPEARSTIPSRFSRQCSDFDFDESPTRELAHKPRQASKRASPNSKAASKITSTSSLINRLLLEKHRIVAKPNQTLLKKGYSSPMSLSTRLGIVLKRDDKSKLDDLAKENAGSSANDLRARLRAAIEQANPTVNHPLIPKKISLAIKTQQHPSQFKPRALSFLEKPKHHAFSQIPDTKQAARTTIPSKPSKISASLKNLHFALSPPASRAYLPSGALMVQPQSAQRVKASVENKNSFFPERYPMRLKQDRQAVTARGPEKRSSSDSRAGLQTSQTKLSSIGFQSRISFLAHGSISKDGIVEDHSVQVGPSSWGKSGGSKSQLLTNYSSVQGAPQKQAADN